MSEENTGQASSEGTHSEGQGGEADPIKNLKAEFNRKLDSGMADINKKLESVLASLKTPQKQEVTPPASTQEEDIGDLVYTNPKKYAQIVAERATQAATSAVSNHQAAQTRQQQVAAQLMGEFPELQNSSSALYKKAVELHSQLDEGDKSNLSSWKTVVYQAAMDLDMKPKSKRTHTDESSEDFVFSGNSYTNKPSRKKDAVDPMTIEFAKLLGRDTDSKEFKENIKKYSERKQWNRYK